ncbi:MAG: hypothetical protein AVDCRST_MAG30-865, partial [uncultured Solirubrobacteraceae bacterium]
VRARRRTRGPPHRGLLRQLVPDRGGRQAHRGRRRAPRVLAVAARRGPHARADGHRPAGDRAHPRALRPRGLRRARPLRARRPRVRPRRRRAAQPAPVALQVRAPAAALREEPALPEDLRVVHEVGRAVGPGDQVGAHLRRRRDAPRARQPARDPHAGPHLRQLRPAPARPRRGDRRRRHRDARPVHGQAGTAARRARRDGGHQAGARLARPHRRDGRQDGPHRPRPGVPRRRRGGGRADADGGPDV